MNEYDTDSDISLDENEIGGEISNWLDEEDEIVEIDMTPRKPIILIPSDDYIMANVNLFLALLEVDNLGFAALNVEKQNEQMKTLLVETFQPGDVVFYENEVSSDMFFVIASAETAVVAEVEVVRTVDNTEKNLTRLYRGQSFGHTCFVTKKERPRDATVRIPRDSSVSVDIARLSKENFHIWEDYRAKLLVHAVPLIQMIPREERSILIDATTIKEYKDGQHIIRQGEIGEEFFIVREGSVKIVDESPGKEPKVIVTLWEGDFFGERALLSDEPRGASVIAASSITICLSVTKDNFVNAVTSTNSSALLDLFQQRERVIEKRVAVVTKKQPLHLKSSGEQHTITETSELKVTKLEGKKMINNYRILSELGKGSFGEVFLCEDSKTGAHYAMKMIGRSSSMSETASNNLRREIAVMKRLKHENIVSLIEVIDDLKARRIYLIQEYMDGGALMGDVETMDPIPTTKAWGYFRDIVCGISYLHTECIIHRGRSAHISCI